SHAFGGDRFLRRTFLNQLFRAAEVRVVRLRKDAKDRQVIETPKVVLDRGGLHHSHCELIEVIGSERRGGRRGEEREKEESGVREQAYWHVAADLHNGVAHLGEPRQFKRPRACSQADNFQKISTV